MISYSGMVIKWRHFAIGCGKINIMTSERDMVVAFDRCRRISVAFDLHGRAEGR